MSGGVVITGLGMVTPIGSDPETILRHLRAGLSAIAPITSMDADFLVAEVSDFDDDVDSIEEDRASRMATAAARAAVRQAAQTGGLDLTRAGITVGASGSGQFQNMRFTVDRKQAHGPQVAVYHDRNVPHFQADRLARAFGSTGPRASVCSASTGSAVAIAVATRWLRAGRVPVAIAGGAEVLTLLTLMGMGSLGIMARQPTAPFSGADGITFGEGAAFFVLETAEGAIARGAKILAEIRGFGSSSDGYDTISNDPSGHGLARAVRSALRDADMPPSRIDWVRASGTGHRDQDLAETLALKEVFLSDDPAGRVPPVSSIEPLIGHANGASPALGVGFASLCLNEGLIPATHHVEGTRPGCDLDYVPNVPREQPIETVLCDCVAFGGTNSALVVTRHDPRSPRPARRRAEVVVTGLGVVSPAGRDIETLAATLYRPWSERPAGGPVARVENWRPQAEWPGFDLRRSERVGQFTIVAAARAMALAGLTRGTFDPDRVGLTTGLFRGPATASDKFYDEILRAPASPALGRNMLKMGRFSIASAASQALRLLGPSSTFSEGTTAGLQAFCHAVEELAQDDGLDALVVIAADEVSPMSLRIDSDAGRVADSGHAMRPYDAASRGSVAGEGAVALVLERAEAAKRRGARGLARVAGYGLGSASPAQGRGLAETLARATTEAMEHAAITSSDLDLVVGCGRGRPSYDLAELEGLTGALEDRAVPCPLTSVFSPVTGVPESASGLLALAGGLLTLRNGSAPPFVGASSTRLPHPLCWVGPDPVPASYRRILVSGGTDAGVCASVVLEDERD